MSEAEKQPRNEWQKPELVKIGSIADVAGKPVPVLQAAGNTKS